MCWADAAQTESCLTWHMELRLYVEWQQKKKRDVDVRGAAALARGVPVLEESSTAEMKAEHD
jgi:hypothetical protein